MKGVRLKGLDESKFDKEAGVNLNFQFIDGNIACFVTEKDRPDRYMFLSLEGLTMFEKLPTVSKFMKHCCGSVRQMSQTFRVQNIKPVVDLDGLV